MEVRVAGCWHPRPSLASVRCLVAKPGASYDWHSHPFEEFTLVTGDKAIIGYAGQKKLMRENTLCITIEPSPMGLVPASALGCISQPFPTKDRNKPKPPEAKTLAKGESVRNGDTKE